MKLNLDIERLEARIAPGGLPTGGGEPGEKVKGNNGWGNGGGDPPPGNSLNGDNSQHDSKEADVDR